MTDADNNTSKDALREAVIKAVRTVHDPEIPVNIYELGLVYDLAVDDAGKVDVKMTLTSPACPVAESLPGEVARKIKEVEGVSDASVELVWDPPWSPAKMTDAAKLQLGMDLDSDEPPKMGGQQFYGLGKI